MFFMPVSYAEEIKTIFVGPNLVDCVGVSTQKCIQVRDDERSEWTNFYDKIDGFDFVEGHSYKISVQVVDVENPPSDASSKKYELVKIIEEKSFPHHIPYMNLCAPGFVSLGEICVLNDRCGPGAYAGKVCIIDGIKQPYLRPLQQGNAGISTGNVICAEPLTLIFKYDLSPACVHPESVGKLKDRGWYTEKPIVACTLEYYPVCGVDNITYGNMCALEAEHVTMSHQGECKDEMIPTEFELDEKYQNIQDEISKVSKDIFNGKYNGHLHLDNASTILENGKNQLSILLEQYKMLDDESKTDMQIAMRFSTLGKMGFASIDSQINIIKNQIAESSSMSKTMSYTKHPPQIDPEKGYFVDEIADGVYWLVSSGYQTMFVTTGEGVIVVDAPQPIGEKYLQAILDVTSEPITHMIYSHSHADHTGAAGQIFSPDITYISQKQTADTIKQENSTRPIPSVTFDDSMYSLTVGDQTLELYYLGNFHSNGDILILVPQQKVAMLVDLMRPDEPPYRAFGGTSDIDLYLKTHDVLQDYDFDVLITGHTSLLATKDDVKTNKQFTESVMENAQIAIDSNDSNPAEMCVDTTIKQWEGKLENLETFMADHCTAMINYIKEKP